MIPTAAVSASTTYLHADPKLAAWVAAEDNVLGRMLPIRQWQLPTAFAISAGLIVGQNVAEVQR